MSRTALRLLFVLMAAVLVLGAGWLIFQSRGQTAILPTGTPVTLVQWEYGKTKSLRLPGLQGWERFLPPRVVSTSVAPPAKPRR